MEIYYIRHAIAVDRMDPSLSSDEERWLTKEGIGKMERAAQGLTTIVSELDHIYTSTYVRAQQTAVIVSEAFGSVPLTETTDLTPGVSFQAVKKIISKHPDGASIALVGHEPDMSHLISLMISDTSDADVQMKKGAVARIDLYGSPAKGCGRLIWLLQPAALRALA